MRHHAALKSVPFALALQHHGKKRITEVSALARAHGIPADIPVADAKVILPSLHIVDDDPLLHQQLLKKLCAWCIRYTPVAAVDEPHGLLLDVTGCAHLWNGEEMYLNSMLSRLQALGYHVQAAMADTVGAAWAFSRYGKAAAIVAPHQHKKALLNLPPEALRLEIPVLERLHKLGLHHIGSFAGMEPRALRRRFGSHLVERLEQAFGDAPEPLEPFMPLEPYEERLPCLEPVQTRKAIEMALEKLLTVTCDRLSQEGKGIRAAHFRGFRIDGHTTAISVTTNRPSVSLPHLSKLFAMQLERFEPAAGIELFMLTASKVQELVPVQHTLWTAGRSLESDHVGRLLDYIQGKFGRQAVRRYLPAERHMPEHAVQQATSLVQEPATEWRTCRRRPVSILEKPEKIVVTAPVPDYPPMNFRYRNQLHTIKKADGPERIEPEWWLQNGLHRDYYVVEDEEGRRYWIFRLGHYSPEQKPDWFIHGFFD